MITGLFARLRSWARGLLHRDAVESDMAEEFRHHIDMRTRDLIDEGLAPKEARRRAHLEFGHVEGQREAARAARGLRFFDQIGFSWIDVKLGMRMLWKHPGLTTVSVFALAVGIPVGMAPIHLSNAIEAPIPEDTENRIRAIRYWDPVTTSRANVSYREFDLMRETLATFESVGAYRGVTYNIATEDDRAAPVAGAEVTASVFDMLATPPLLGRGIAESDEAPGSADVVVLGSDVWEARFASDREIVGKTVLVAQRPHMVIGVMPAGFYFPSNQQAWLPLRTEQVSGPGQGRPLLIVGRLAPSVSDDEAQAEVGAVALRSQADRPETRARLQPEVVPYALSFMGIPRAGLEGMPEFYLLQAVALLLLLVACGNVAMLIFARTATRFTELAVRTALGASRARIVSQVFAETLVLSVLAAALGVFTVNWVLGRINIAAMVGEEGLPYWLSLQITPKAVLWAVVFAAASATVAGVLPAMRITGNKIQENIRRAEAGRSGIKFGGVTSALIVADVAIAIIVVALALGLSDQLRNGMGGGDLVGIPADEYLAVELRTPADAMEEGGGVDLEQFRARLAATQEAVTERLRAEPGVRGVAVADALPRMDHRSRRIEVEGVESPSGGTGRYMRTATVDIGFFSELGQPILSGRGFVRADVEVGARPVIVNTVFIDRVLGGRDPVGRRLRFVGDGGTAPGPWLEIVGVVGHLGINTINPEGDLGVYVPAAPGEIYPLQIGIHVGDSPESLIPRVREIVSEVDPNAFLGTTSVLGDVQQGDWYLMVAVAAGFALLVAILVTLAASAIYAIMSFSIAERTREIGIRAALGAGRGSIVFTILRRSLTQIAVGALLGIPLATWVLGDLASPPGEEAATGPAASMALGLGLVIVLLVGLFSCVVPTRRALRIEPSEALRGAD